MAYVIIDGVEYIPRPDSVKIGLKSKTLHEFLAGLRNSMGITLDEAAARIGCARSYLHGLEKGRTEPSLRMAVKICNGYSIELWMLKPFVTEPTP